MRAVGRDRLEDGRPRRDTTGAAAAGKLEDSGEDDLCSLSHGVAHRELGVGLLQVVPDAGEEARGRDHDRRAHALTLLDGDGEAERPDVHVLRRRR